MLKQLKSSSFRSGASLQSSSLSTNHGAGSTIMTFDTTKAGSGATQVVLPFVNGGTYNCNISWGDGSNSSVTTWNDAALTHTYAAGGVYDVAITGVCNGFRFNNGGDKLKLMIIKRWGKDFRLGNANGYFYGCANLTITATDVLNLTGTTTLASMFWDCTSLVTVPSMNSWDVSAVTNMYTMFYNCTVFNQNISNWNTAAVINMAYMFAYCSAFNQSVSNFNTAAVITMSNMFILCSAFNQSVSNFNTNLVTTMTFMFYGCSVFNQDISGFDVADVTTMDSMFLNANALSTANYDALLIAWSAQAVQPNVSFHGGDAQYSAGAAATARGVLTGAPNNWTITDSGQV